MSKFEVIGGLVSGTEESRGKISLDRPNRQWDYPYVASNTTLMLDANPNVLVMHGHHTRS